MDKVSQAVTDVERKLGKVNTIMSKGASKMTMKDMIKQNQKGNSIKATVKKGIKAAEVRMFLCPGPRSFSLLEC